MAFCRCVVVAVGCGLCGRIRAPLLMPIVLYTCATLWLMASTGILEIDVIEADALGMETKIKQKKFTGCD